jgi:hypothetical protein
MESRTTGAINLGPTGNIQGTHNFLSSKTGDLNVRRKWTELPVLSEVIDKLDEMTKDKTECGELDYEIKDVINEDDKLSQRLNKNAEESDMQFVETYDNNKNHIEDETQIVEALETDENEFSTEGTYGDEIIGSEKDYELEQSEENDNYDGKEEDKKTYNLQSSRNRDYSYCFAMVSVKTGLEKWEDKAKIALFDELNHFIKEKVFEQVVSPSNEQKKSAL